jgi:hypothetical protein
MNTQQGVQKRRKAISRRSGRPCARQCLVPLNASTISKCPDIPIQEMYPSVWLRKCCGRFNERALPHAGQTPQPLQIVLFLDLSFGTESRKGLSSFAPPELRRFQQLYPEKPLRCYISTASKTLPRETRSRTALDRSLRSSFLISLRNS